VESVDRTKRYVASYDPKLLFHLPYITVPLVAAGNCIEATTVLMQGGMMQGPQGMGPVMVLSKWSMRWLP
jgi:hypothetical protein